MYLCVHPTVSASHTYIFQSMIFQRYVFVCCSAPQKQFPCWWSAPKISTLMPFSELHEFTCCYLRNLIPNISQAQHLFLIRGVNIYTFEVINIHKIRNVYFCILIFNYYFILKHPFFFKHNYITNWVRWITKGALK